MLPQKGHRKEVLRIVTNAYTYTGLEAGQYRIRVYAEKWTEGAEFGEANHAVTLYHHFTITEPEPELQPYYSITCHP